jgi:hypothetical protein
MLGLLAELAGPRVAAGRDDCRRELSQSLSGHRCYAKENNVILLPRQRNDRVIIGSLNVIVLDVRVDDVLLGIDATADSKATAEKLPLFGDSS